MEKINIDILINTVPRTFKTVREANKRPDYTSKQVRWMLENYLSLAEGKVPNDGLAEPDYGCRIQKSKSLKAIFEKPTQMKTDIDNAIQSLKPTERAVIITLCISGFQYQEVGYWWDMSSVEIRNIEDYTIRKIKRFLNQGEKATNYRENTKIRKFSR